MVLQKGIIIHQYLDDWLVRARSHQTGLTQTLEAICQKLGWLVNMEKSELDPKQVFDFTGYQLMSLIGLLTAIEKQVHLGWLHMRPIQLHLKTIGGYQNH